MARVQEVAGRVVDVEEHGVETAAGLGGVESGGGVGGEGEEVAVDEAAAGIGGEAGAQRDEAAAVPIDDSFEGIDDKEGADGGVAQGGHGGVAKTEAADDDVERAETVGEAEIGEGDLDFVEEAGHEEFVAEFDLEDFEIVEDADAPTAQGQVAHVGGAEIEFLKIAGHPAGMRRCGGLSNLDAGGEAYRHFTPSGVWARRERIRAQVLLRLRIGGNGL